MTFFFDRNLSVHLARMLSHFDRENIIIHQDDDGRFEPDSEDVFIISTLASEKPAPVWITGDLGQKHKSAERAALRDSKMTIFFFRRNTGTPHHQALKALAVWPEIVRHAATVRAPTAFEVPCGKIGKLNQKIDRLGLTAELFKNA